MLELMRIWYQRYIADPQIMSLTLILLTGLGTIIFFGHLLAPVIAALVIAFVLETLVTWLCRLGVRRVWAVWIVFLLFLLAVGLFFGGMVPLLLGQLAAFLHEFPRMIKRGQLLLFSLPSRYHFITESQAHAFMGDIQHLVSSAGESILSHSLSSVLGLFTLIVYAFLVPILVFFFLLHKDKLLGWVLSFLPHDRQLAIEVWEEIGHKFIGYVRGKVYEVIIVWAMTYTAFSIIGLHFSLMMAVMVGLAIIIPYVGAIVATLPLVFVAYVQWGFDVHFLAVLAAYTVILFVDGNLLIPLLYAELISLHPVAIIIAVLFFGGIWGVWGIFFAIPLGTLIEAIIHAVRRRVRNTFEVLP